jgi:hypothetical protein
MSCVATYTLFLPPQSFERVLRLARRVLTYLAFDLRRDVGTST